MWVHDWSVAGLAPSLHLSVPTAQRRELHGHLIPCSSASGDQMADALSHLQPLALMASKSPSAFANWLLHSHCPQARCPLPPWKLILTQEICIPFHLPDAKDIIFNRVHAAHPLVLDGLPLTHWLFCCVPMPQSFTFLPLCC